MTIQDFTFESAHTPEAWHGRGEMALLGCGHALPGEAISTNELLAHVDKTFGLDLAHRGRIYSQKMNIQSRHLSRALLQRHEQPKAGCSNPELVESAVLAALDNAGLKIGDIGYLIGHTATPAMLVPSNISLAAERLGYNGPHMELRQACTGFANALVIAEGLLASQDARPVVIVGSETGSVYFDPMRVKEDPGQLVNMVQMGDAAAAVVLGPKRESQGNAARTGVLSKIYYGQLGGARAPGFSLPIGGSNQTVEEGYAPEFEHSFQEVRKSGPELFLAGLTVSASAGTSYQDVDYLLPHQANGLMDELLEETLGLSRSKTLVNGHKVGNTGSAAIWLALSQSIEHFTSGQSVLVLGAEATKYMFGGFVYQHGI